jgi:hypothetical protein
MLQRGLIKYKRGPGSPILIKHMRGPRSPVLIALKVPKSIEI